MAIKTMKESDFEQFCEMVPQLISDVSKMMSYRNKVYRNVTEVMDDKMMEKTVIVLKDLKMAIRRVEKIASKFKEMSGSDPNSSMNVSAKITTTESTPSRKRAPPSDDENNKSSSVKQKVKKKRLDTGTPVRQKSKTDVSKDIPKIKKIIERKKWDFSPLDPNDWEFENGEFICIFCGTDQQTIEKMESHFIMPPNCCEKFDKIESLFGTDDANSATIISVEHKEPVSTQPALESILESEDEKTEKKESSPDEEKTSSSVKKEDSTIEKPNDDSEDLEIIEKEISKDEKPEKPAEIEVPEAQNPEIETPEKAPENTPLENIQEDDQKTENKTDNMNSKPNETDISNADKPPPQTDDPPLKTDNPPMDDPQEDDPVTSIDSSVDSSEAFKCRHCEVDPFQNETELKEHIKLKHEIKCKFCDSTFPSRGYMMTHQRNDHPVELKALQERRKSKKAQKAAS